MGFAALRARWKYRPAPSPLLSPALFRAVLQNLSHILLLASPRIARARTTHAGLYEIALSLSFSRPFFLPPSPKGGVKVRARNEKAARIFALRVRQRRRDIAWLLPDSVARYLHCRKDVEAGAAQFTLLSFVSWSTLRTDGVHTVYYTQVVRWHFFFFFFFFDKRAISKCLAWRRETSIGTTWLFNL